MDFIEILTYSLTMLFYIDLKARKNLRRDSYIVRYNSSSQKYREKSNAVRITRSGVYDLQVVFKYLVIKKIS